jgi:hypothetical protein
MAPAQEVPQALCKASMSGLWEECHFKNSVCQLKTVLLEELRGQQQLGDLVIEELKDSNSRLTKPNPRFAWKGKSTILDICSG